jgi:hypothetical protein
MSRSKGLVIGFGIATALFCLPIGFTAYAQLRLPQVSEAYTRLGSAIIAHLAIGEGPEAWGWAAGTSVRWGLSYFFWRKVGR